MTGPMKPLAPRNPNIPIQGGEIRPSALRAGSTWRERLQQILLPVWPKLQQLPKKKRDRYLRELYPFAPPWRGGVSWQYKVWRDEIARLEGRLPPLGTNRKQIRQERARNADPDQGNLFE